MPALLTTLAARIREFAEILTQRRGTTLDTWISAVRSDDLPALHAFTDGVTEAFRVTSCGVA